MDSKYNHFIFRIEEFYHENKRDLPWRKEVPNAYEVWLSEVIMQQTRVSQGTPYFERILHAFPTVHDLALAPEDKLLALWTGLGYYNRARNLQRGAKEVVEHYKGELPQSYQELLKISGIGPYTAAAIASICFAERKGVVDGNVYRVLSRYFGIETPIDSSSGKQEFQILADALVAEAEHAGNYNQGIMEFGALWCTPKKPNCMFCVMQEGCDARRKGLVAELPVKAKKQKRSVEHLHYLLVEKDGKWAMKKRDNSGIWAGLYEFVSIPQEPEGGELAGPVVIHKLSHKDLVCHFWKGGVDLVEEENWVYLGPEEMGDVGLPIVIKNFAKSVNQNQRISKRMNKDRGKS